MKKKIIALAILLCFSVALFCACGSANYDKDVPMGAGTYEEGMDVSNEEGAGTVVITEDRLVIYTVDMSMSVQNLSATMKKISAKVKEAGGWVSDSYYNDENYSRYTLRIPTVNLDAFISSIEEGSDLNYKSVSSVDITDNYVAIEEKKKALEKEKALIEAGLAEGGLSYSETKEATIRLREIAQELDRYESKLSAYKKQVDYSTVNLTIYQKGAYVKASAWDKVGDAFFGSGRSLGTVFGWLIVVLVAILPYLGVIVGIFGLYVLIKFIICKITKKKFTLFAKARENAKYRQARREELKKGTTRKVQDSKQTEPEKSVTEPEKPENE